jgi:hypothetical protein
MISSDNFDRLAQHFSAEILDRHLGGGHRANAGNIRINARHVLEHANLDHTVGDLFLSLCSECAR